MPYPTRRSKRTEQAASPSPPPLPPPPPPPGSPSPSPSPPPPVAALKRISTVVGPAPSGAQDALQHVRRALADRASYSGLLLLNVAPSASKAVRRMVASLADGPAYKLDIAGPYPDARDTDQAVAALDENVPEGATFYITIEGAKPELASFKTGVEWMTCSIREARPDIKLVFAAVGAASSLKSEDALPELEVRDVRSIPYDFAAESERLRYTKILDYIDGARSARASRLLTGLSAASARQVVNQAKILGKRRRDDGEASNDDRCLADLSDALESLRARSGQRPAKGEAIDLSYIQQFLRPDLKQDSIVAAVAGVPDEVKQFVTTLKRSAAMRGVVPRVKRTMLLKGPPGTGKTTVARALAAELGYPVLTPKSSSFVNEYIGRSANNVYRFFEQARAFADVRGTPVVIFFDEIDALLKKRSGEAQSGEREYDRIVNAFLESLEGIDGGTDDRLIVIGATNFSGTLDSAGLDRFSVKAELALPNAHLLAQIYNLHLQDRKHNLTAEDIASIAETSTGLSGRHVVNILDKAGVLAFDATPEGGEVCIDAGHLREALRIVSSESETAYIQGFLKLPRQGQRLDDALADIPKEVRRFTHMLAHFQDLKRVVPEANKSLLLSGPPGTGKTTLARAIAEHMQLPMIAPSAGALTGKYHGESAEHVHRLFAQARVYARAHDTQVVIFLDDLDAMLSERSEGGSEHRALVAAFLENMRGIDTKQNERLIFIGATNVSEALDAAVRDRFHLRVPIKRPEGGHLRQIFSMHLKGRRHNVTDTEIKNLMGLAAGFSGRNVVEAINKAGYLAHESAAEGGEPCIDAAALRGGIIEEARQNDKDGYGPPPPGMYN